MIALQLEQDFGVHTETWREIYHRRRVCEPLLTGFLGSASLTLPERCSVLQTQSRRSPAAWLNPKTRHHFVNTHGRVPDLFWLSRAYRRQITDQTALLI